MATTMKVTHTPGPWTSSRMLITPHTKDRRCGFVVNGPDNPDDGLWGVRICDLRVPSGMEGFQEGEANARLISAAPDLLKACELLLTEMQTRTDYATPDADEIAAMQAAADAISKATT
jgi:hypothetical protein